MQLFACLSILWAFFTLVTSRSYRGTSNLRDRSSYEDANTHLSLVKRDDYSDAVTKGKDLWKLLQSHCDKEVTEPSLAQLKGELKWDVLDADEDDDETTPADGTETMLKKLGVDVCTEFWQRYASSPSELVDGKPMKNEFSNSYGTQAGVIIAEDNKRIKGSKIAWSTVTAMIWEDTCKNVDNTDPKNLKYIFRDNILNTATKSFIDKVGMGREFKPEQEGFFALLGSVNGRGVAYLLLQHSSIVGKKTIKQIVTFKADDGAYEMYFELEDWKGSAVQGACASTATPNDE